MLLAEAANAAGLCFTLLRYSVPRLPFNPVELVEEPQRLLRRTAAFLPRLEGIDKASPGVGHASNVGGPFQRTPCGIAVTHHNATVIAEEGLRVDLAAARLIIQKNDRLVAALAAAISPHIRYARGLFVLLLENLNRRLVAMDERL
ncbi:hypothetical protein ABIA96_006166 [Bradyrhizobium sp. LB11.1]